MASSRSICCSSTRVGQSIGSCSSCCATWSRLARRTVSSTPRRELLALIRQIADQGTATEILSTLLRYYVQANVRVDENTVRTLLQETPSGDAIMQTFIDRYIEQGVEKGRQQGGATVLLHLIERKFGPPSESVRTRIASADPETLLAWSERILTADSVDAVLH